MNLLAAFAIGLALGLACFGWLWLAVRRSIATGGRRGGLAVGQLARLAMCGLVFCAVSRAGFAPIVSALGGFWIARWHLVRRLGVAADGQ
jgi:F1F0 ATPase subunit 2